VWAFIRRSVSLKLGKTRNRKIETGKKPWPSGRPRGRPLRKHRRLLLDADMRLDAIEHEAGGNAGEFAGLDFVQAAAVDAALSLQLRRVGAFERHASFVTDLSPDKGPLANSLPAFSLQSRDRARAPCRHIQYGLLARGLPAALAGISGSALPARTVTAPAGKRVEGTRQVAEGIFDFRPEILTLTIICIFPGSRIEFHTRSPLSGKDYAAKSCRMEEV
jgi:hypothetical protein